MGNARAADTERGTEDVVIDARAIRMVYEGGTQELEILRRVDLKVCRGDTVAITGASGVGKSTLLHILGTLDRPTEGQLFIDGEDVGRLDDDALASFRNEHIGFVFQHHNLLPEFTALENVQMPALIAALSPSEAHQRAAQLLDKVGLAERLAHRPGELSGGECQRVAIARALMMRPQVVLADEPSGNLDPETSERLHGVIQDLAREERQTFVVMTHDRDLASGLGRHGHIEAGVLQFDEVSNDQSAGRCEVAM